MSNIIETLVVKIASDITEFQTGITNALKGTAEFEQAASKIGNVGDGISKVGTSISKFGEDLTKKLSVPIAAISTASVKMFGDFEQGVNKINTLDLSAPPRKIDNIKQGIIDLSNASGVAAGGLAESVYQMGSAMGELKDDVVDYVEIANKAAVGGFTDSQTAVDGLTTAMNTYGKTTKEEMQEISDQMLMAQNLGKTTFGEMASSMGNVVPIAKSLDVGTQELFSTYATLTKNGIKTAEATTSMKAAFSNIIKPSKEAADTAKELGLNFSAAHLQNVGWPAFLEEIKDKTGGNAEVMAKLFGSVEALNAVSVLTSEKGFTDLKNSMDAMENSAGATEAAYNKMREGTKASFSDIVNSLKNSAIQFGEVIAPMLDPLVEKIKSAITWFSQLSDESKETVVKIAGIVAAAGPVIMVIGGIVSVIGGAVTAFAGMSTAVASAGGVMAILTGPVGLAVAAIAGLTVAGVALYNHFSEKLLPEINHFGDGVSAATAKATEKFLDMNNSVTSELSALAITGKEITDEMKNSIVGNISAMAQETVQAIEASRQSSLDTLTAMFADTQALTEEEKQEIVNKTNEAYDAKKAKIISAETEIKAIMEQASTEKRALTDEEMRIITKNQEIIASEGIKHMTDSEAEQKVILEKMKENASIISAQQAAEVVKNAVEQKDKVIEEANDQYDKTLKEIIKQRDEVGSISKEQADKLIEEAKRQKDETVKKAEETHAKIVEEAQKQAGEHIDKVNWETGEILTKWDKFKTDVSRKWQEIKETAAATWDDLKTATVNKWEEIKNKTSETADNIKTSVSSKFNEAKTSISNILDEIAAFFTSMPDKALEWGKNLIGGFVDGIKSMASEASNAANNIVKNVSDFLGFNSPSKKGEGRFITHWGYNMIDGFLDGVKNSVPLVNQTMNKVIPNLDNAIEQINVSGGNVSATEMGSGLPMGGDINNNTEIIINTEGLFKGAVLNVRDDSDIDKIVRLVVIKLADFIAQKNRNSGLQLI